MSDEWYKDGVRFKCEGVECGDCCSGRWGPGFVWLKFSDIERLIEHLAMPIEEFGMTFVRDIRTMEGRGYSLIEKPNHDCIFYEEGKGCTVYEARPDQCRSYPFWPQVVESKEAWDGELKHCPGINCGEPCDLHTSAEIKSRRAMHPRMTGEAP